MSQQVDLGLDHALASAETFFDGVFAPLEAWLPRLRQRLTGALEDGLLTGAQLAALVEHDAHAVLDSSDRPLYGAGFCASESLVSEGNPLAWWQGPERSLLASSAFGPGQAAIDLVRLEWYRVPEATGERHVAGPFVDYLCSNEITITSALPVVLGTEFVGVICADVLVSSLERALLPNLAGGVTLLNANGRVIVSSHPGWETGDRHPGAEALGTDPSTATLAADEGSATPGSAFPGAEARLVRSARYPLAATFG
ncbi:hypothetical protein EDF60_0187 [Leucobacter luti]|uniref:PDC sensor domain-containing protein n=1 Tax=Leucobacter luti TaxID=340320 RepID=UPI00104360BE|nr:hypothetical protein [Leucobacter luti]MCW2288880.1 hypothetical protein [Leucobacter luti]TCK44968.1 hypothetical protein EDF60_0187 [Leucobacter luti]